MESMPSCIGHQRDAEDHTAEYIADELKNVIDEWNATKKIIAVVTQNAANIVAAICLNGWKHIPCFAHTLNLIVQDSLKDDPVMNDVSKKCRDIVSYFHRSCKATERLMEIQTRLELKSHKLIQDVQTRWNSTYFMFDRLIEQHDAVTTALCLLNKNDMCLTEIELTEMKHAVNFLRPFQAATQEMSGEDYVCLSKVIPLSKSLQQLTADANVSSICLGQNLTTEMAHRFRNIEANLLLAFPCLLDPRFKKVAFSDSAALDACTRCLVEEMKAVASAGNANCCVIEESTCSTANGNGHSNGSNTVQPENILWKRFDQRVEDSTQCRTDTVGALVEKQQYLQHSNIDRHEDPLVWWKQNSSHLPMLQELAKKYLCIPATSVPAE